MEVVQISAVGSLLNFTKRIDLNMLNVHIQNYKNGKIQKNNRRKIKQKI